MSIFTKVKTALSPKKKAGTSSGAKAEVIGGILDAVDQLNQVMKEKPKPRNVRKQAKKSSSQLTSITFKKYSC